MNQAQGSRDDIVLYWMEKAEEALSSAGSELSAGRLAFAMNRAYYACFYAASALLLKQGHRFLKHSGLRAALHQHVVKPGMLSSDFGKVFDRLFESRQEGDYFELIHFEKAEVNKAIADATSFVSEMRRLLASG